MTRPIVWLLRLAADACWWPSRYLERVSGVLIRASNRLVERQRRRWEATDGR